MKAILMSLFMLFSITLKAQDMRTPEESVVQLFVATDQQDWNTVATIFSKEVLLDYSSMNGQPAATLSPEQITTAWKGILAGFEHTHHQLGNIISKTNGNTASVFCYGTATHYLPDEAGNLWTVVGSYDFDLWQNAVGKWEVKSMIFHFKYQDGNAGVAQKAIAKLQ